MYYLFIMRRFVYIGKNHRFTAFLDSYLHTWLAIVTANELGLAFPPRNLPKKFRPDLSKFYLVIGNRQTNRQTYAGDSIIPRESFRGDNYTHLSYGLFSRTTLVSQHQNSKNSLNLNEEETMGFWEAVASAGSYANNLHLAPDR